MVYSRSISNAVAARKVRSQSAERIAITQVGDIRRSMWKNPLGIGKNSRNVTVLVNPNTIPNTVDRDPVKDALTSPAKLIRRIPAVVLARKAPA